MPTPAPNVQKQPSPLLVILILVVMAALALSYSYAVTKEWIPNFLAGDRHCTIDVQNQRLGNWPKCDDRDGGNGISKRTFVNGTKIGDFCKYVDIDAHCCQELPDFGDRDCPR